MMATSRDRIATACGHREPDKLPVDFGGGFQTGIHVSMVYQLRQALGLDKPGTPVKVVEVYQMLGEITDDLREALGIDTVPVHGSGTMFGYPATEFKEWQLHDGTPVLVPVDFNTVYDPNGDLRQYPVGDAHAPASGLMPKGGYFFVNAAMAATKSSIAKGLDSVRLAPSFCAILRKLILPVGAAPEMARIGTSGLSRRRSTMVSMPSFSGIRMSVTTRSAGAAANA